MGLSFTGKESDNETGEITADAIRNFLKKVNIKSVKSMGISKENFMGITPMVFKDACYNFVPKELTRSELEIILSAVYDNYS